MKKGAPKDAFRRCIANLGDTPGPNMLRLRYAAMMKPAPKNRTQVTPATMPM